MSIPEHEHRTPDDLLAVSAALDELGARERASAPAALEARIIARTRELIPAPAPLVITKYRSRRVFSAMRVAAMVAICGTSAAIWLGSLGRTARAAQPTLEDDVNLMLALRPQDSVGERIDVLFSDTAALRDSMKSIGDGAEGDSL
jgi:hypothetical protein